MATDDIPVVHKRIFKVRYFTRDDPETQGATLTGDAIEHEGELWLVPAWTDSKDEAWSAPIRLVSLSAPPAGPHLTKIEIQNLGADYLLNYPIPIADFQNLSAPQTDHGFVVIEKPFLKILRPH